MKLPYGVWALWTRDIINPELKNLCVVDAVVETSDLRIGTEYTRFIWR